MSGEEVSGERLMVSGEEGGEEEEADGSVSVESGNRSGNR